MKNAEVARKNRGSELLSDLSYMEERNVGFLIRNTHRSLRRIMNARIAPLGISSAMWTQLWELWHEDGMTQTELARRIKLEKPSVNSTISKMEAMGLIERRESKHDRREKHVFLTEKAQALKPNLTAMTYEINEDVLACLNPSEVDDFLRLLRRISRSAEDTADRTTNTIRTDAGDAA